MRFSQPYHNARDMIRTACGNNELPTAVGYVNTKPSKRSASFHTFAGSTINNREP